MEVEIDDLSSVNFWARSCPISRAGATGNSRATLPLVTSSEGREVGARCGHSHFQICSPAMLSLMIADFDADPSRVTEILGLTPTTQRRFGERTPAGRPGHGSLWLYEVDSPEVRSGASHDAALKALVSVIARHSGPLGEVRRELNPKTMSITGGYYFDEAEQAGVWLDPDDMRVLVEAGVGWGIDLYSAKPES